MVDELIFAVEPIREDTPRTILLKTIELRGIVKLVMTGEIAFALENFAAMRA